MKKTVKPSGSTRATTGEKTSEEKILTTWWRSQKGGVSERVKNLV